MYGDTTIIRLRARELRRAGDEIRADAEMLSARAHDVPWQGLAAEAMRALVLRRTLSLQRTADLHDDAALALDDHADAVDRVKRLIAAIEHKVMSLVAAARDRLAGVVGVVSALIDIDPLDELLDRFVPPPSGHRDWLTVHLPGLDLGAIAS